MTHARTLLRALAGAALALLMLLVLGQSLLHSTNVAPAQRAVEPTAREHAPADVPSVDPALEALAAWPAGGGR